jgi:hypothetical protein
LDQADKEYLEDKVEIIQGVYKRITNKEIVIEFRNDPVFYTIKKS